jgi:hypothetical protein
MTHTDTSRRHPDGSIDFDFYRADAKALRRQAMRDVGTLRGVRRASAGVLAAAVLGLTMVLAFAPRQDRNVVAEADVSAALHPVR